MELSPKRNLLRHGSLVRSVMHPQDALGGKLVFTSGNKNTGLVTDDGIGNIIKENDDVLLSDLDTKLFLPYTFTFKCKNPIGIFKVVETNPFGRVQFKWLGNDCEGYIMKVSKNIALQREQEFTLLASVNNPNLSLI
jgi:hypothetical protein